jgi:hypothetical protein
MGPSINLDQLIKKKFLFNKVQYSSRFGCHNSYYSHLINKKFMIVDLNYLILTLKKMMYITYKISLFRGIFLTYISKSSIIEFEKIFYNIDDWQPVQDVGYGYLKKRNLVDDENINILEVAKGWFQYQEYFSVTHDSKPNFYVVLTNGLFGFISNFKKVFLKHIKRMKVEKWPTDYSRLTLPSIVFITKTCYNEYYELFRVFFKKRIICIRTFSLVEEVNINLGYCLSVNDCSKIYDICENIFYLNSIYRKNKW